MRADGAGERELFLEAATRGASYLSSIRDHSVAPEMRDRALHHPLVVERVRLELGPRHAREPVGPGQQLGERPGREQGRRAPTRTIAPASVGSIRIF
jgi:hypothetical protein